MRHILVHVYYDADADTIWRVAPRDVPTMIEVLDRVLGARDLRQPGGGGRTT